MNKNDLTISNDDLADIFGGRELSVPGNLLEDKPALKPSLSQLSVKSPAAEKQAAAVKPAGKPPEKSNLILDRDEEAFKAQEPCTAHAKKNEEHSVDDLIKRAQEIEKQIAAPQETRLVFKDFTDEKTVAEMIHAFNDLKAVFSRELAEKTDQRSVDNMMLRTLEKTAVNFVLLKNTSWDLKGQLKQDGSIDTERFVKNMAASREQIQEIDKEIEESLKALMFMRLSAVKKGLGADKYAEIKNGLIRRAAAVEGGYKKSISDFIKKNIMEHSMRKADEEK